MSGSVDAGPFTLDYDESSNLTRDSRKRLQISHNVLNLPMIARDTVRAMTSTMTYTFLGDGTKVGARVLTITHSNGMNIMPMDRKGKSYRGSFVYNVSDSGVQTLESIAVSTGRLITVNTRQIGTVSFESDAFITDHLGNVAAVVKLSGGNDIILPTPGGHYLNRPVPTEDLILEQNDYLPLGTRMPLKTQATNRYRYAGKEEQNIAGMNLSLLDFGARYYDAFVGRWNAIDPMANKYFGMSPYNYCGNDPVNRFDPDGNALWIAIAYEGNKVSEKVQYKEGELYNEDGSLYTGDNEFALKFRDTMNSIIVNTKDTEVLSSLNEIIDNKQQNIIHSAIAIGSSEYNYVQSKDKSGAHKGEPTGTRVVLKFIQEKFDGVTSTDETTVGHEMKHVYDFNVGNFKGDINDKVDGVVSPGEIRAVRFENKIRKAFHLNKRKTYDNIPIE